VLANDTDIDSANLTALLVTNAAHGTVSLNSNGSFSYTPQAGFSGTDSFTYKANDGGADSNTATVTITVNEGGTLQFSAATYSVAENAGNATITITRTGGSAGAATVLFQTSNGTAGSGDYTSVSTTVTFNDGETSKTVNVPITDDPNDEADETVNLTLSNAGGTGQLGTPATAVLTITDNDAAPSITINDTGVVEGDSGTTNAVFTVLLSAPSGLPVTVDFATASGTATAGSDYQSQTGTLSFAPGEVNKTVSVAVNGDTVNEPNETFFVNLSNAQNASIADNQGIGSIQNDDSPVVQFSSSAYGASEGAGHVDIIITRTGDTSATISVDYQTSDLFTAFPANQNPCQASSNGHASDRCDYTTAAGTLRFASGETQKTIQVVITDDAYVEPSEQFSIRLINPSGGLLGAVNTATILISDNDTQVATTNPIDDLDFFIRQQYADFLGRVPDAAGLAFWKQRMTTSCPAGQTCDRIDTALRFFSSDEFRERGYFVYLFYHAALGRRPTYSEWILDVSKLNGPKTVQEQEAAKVQFIEEFMTRQEFMNLYNGAQTGQTFVDALIQRSGVTPANRQTLINNYDTAGRAATLRAFIETTEVQLAFVDRGFVTMLYFGFLRRDAEAGGFDFWMQQLNQTNRDYRLLVGGFINSHEYRFRFAQIP
jgi:VCBS repeat-containing protein